MMIDVKTKILDSRLKALPGYATPGSAGLDLMAMPDEALTINPGESQLVSTGLSIYIEDPNYMAVILPRSGLGHRIGLVLGNLVGLIDADYQGPLMMSLWNRSAERIRVEPMMRVAQLVFIPVAKVSLVLVDDFDVETARGSGGFGSTGVKE